MFYLKWFWFFTRTHLVAACMRAPVCVIFVLDGVVFIVGPATLCVRELILQALFQAEQECPPHYSGPDWLTLLPPASHRTVVLLKEYIPVIICEYKWPNFSQDLTLSLSSTPTVARKCASNMTDCKQCEQLNRLVQLASIAQLIFPSHWGFTPTEIVHLEPLWGHRLLVLPGWMTNHDTDDVSIFVL